MRVSRNSNRINGFVLAGGRSTRMGRDKASIPWGGRSLLDHMIGLLSPVSAEVRVVGRPPLPDRTAGRGPLGGIETALHTSETDANLVVAVDLPYLSPEFMLFFARRVGDSSNQIVACNVGNRFPLCLGISKSVLGLIQKRLDRKDRGEASVHGLIEAADAEIISEAELAAAGFPAGVFRNINTPEDLQAP